MRNGEPVVVITLDELVQLIDDIRARCGNIIERTQFLKSLFGDHVLVPEISPRRVNRRILESAVSHPESVAITGSREARETMEREGLAFDGDMLNFSGYVPGSSAYQSTPAALATVVLTPLGDLDPPGRVYTASAAPQPLRNLDPSNNVGRIPEADADGETKTVTIDEVINNIEKALEEVK